MSETEININVSGGKVTQLAGSIVNNNSQIGDRESSKEFDVALLDDLKSTFSQAVVDEPSDAQNEEPQLTEQNAAEVDGVFEDLKAAAEPEAKPEQIQAATGRWSALLSKHGPRAATACMLFAESALMQYAKVNPLVAGIISAMKALR